MPLKLLERSSHVRHKYSKLLFLCFCLIRLFYLNANVAVLTLHNASRYSAMPKKLATILTQWFEHIRPCWWKPYSFINKLSTNSDFISEDILLWIISDLDILRSDKTTVCGITSEVASAFDTAIILAQGLVQLDSDPPSDGHLRNRTDVPDSKNVKIIVT